MKVLRFIYNIIVSEIKNIKIFISHYLIPLNNNLKNKKIP